MVYKVDGNNPGGGGKCGNDDHSHSIPLMLQPLKDDGVSPIGDPVQLLDRDDVDGPLIEAPNIALIGKVYFLFFSSNCFNTPLYDVSYAAATKLTGPYTKCNTPLMVTNRPFQLEVPGGATAINDGKNWNLVFHGNCPAGRCMFERGVKTEGTTVSIS